jgi:hypothetical protein
MMQVFWILWAAGVVIVVMLRLGVLRKYQSLLDEAGGNPIPAYTLLSAKSRLVASVFVFVAVGRILLIIAPLAFLFLIN